MYVCKCTYVGVCIIMYVCVYVCTRGGPRIFVRGEGLLFIAKVENQKKKKVFHA